MSHAIIPQAIFMDGISLASEFLIAQTKSKAVNGTPAAGNVNGDLQCSSQTNSCISLMTLNRESSSKKSSRLPQTGANAHQFFHQQGHTRVASVQMSVSSFGEVCRCIRNDN